jgi:tetratricopeptide (TPR) repeat protein
LLIRYFQGLLAFYEGDLGKAEELLEATTQKARETHFRSDLARAIVSLGHVKISTGNIEPAHTLLIEGLSLYRKIGSRLGVAIALEGLAKVYSAQSDEKKALKWFAIAQRLRELIGAPIPPVDRPYYDAFLADCRNKLGVSFEKIWSDWSACPAEVLVQETSAIPDPA